MLDGFATPELAFADVIAELGARVFSRGDILVAEGALYMSSVSLNGDAVNADTTGFVDLLGIHKIISIGVHLKQNSLSVSHSSLYLYGCCFCSSWSLYYIKLLFFCQTTPHLQGFPSFFFKLWQF